MTVLTLSVGSGMACFQEHCSGGKSRFDHVQFSSVGFGVFYIVKMIIRTGGHFESAGINLFNRAHTLSATYNIITQSKITGAQFCSWKSLLCCSNLIQLNIWLIRGFSIHNSLALLLKWKEFFWSPHLLTPFYRLKKTVSVSVSSSQRIKTVLSVVLKPQKQGDQTVLIILMWLAWYRKCLKGKKISPDFICFQLKQR